MEHRLERCVAQDAERLTEVAHRSKRYWGYPERYIRAWRESLTVAPAMVRDHEVWACRNGDAIAGFYVLIRANDRMELEHLWVDPEFIGQGVGRLLLEHALAVAGAAGARGIEVTSDPHAEGFYVRYGARRVGRVFAPVESTPRFLPRLWIEVPPSS